MSKFTSAIYHEAIKTAEYFANGVSSLLRTKGSAAWRFNNPGNTVYSKFIASLPGYIGYAIVHNSPDPDAQPYKFAIFDTYENGREACRKNLKRNYANKNISDMTKKYAGKYDKSNDPEAYAAFIISQTGIGKDTTVSQMNDQALDAILNAIEKKEGYIPGKETKVATTNISLTDGIQPVASCPLKVKLGTCEYDWKTNDFGELPAIAHLSDGMAIEVKATNSKGELDTLYSAKAGHESKNILLKRKFVQYKANTLAQKPKVPREKSQPKPVEYIIQSGDILSKIATRFDVSVSELVASNGIKDANRIYPGQKIVIYGKKTDSVENKQDNPVDLSGQAPAAQLGDTYPLLPYPESIETKDIPGISGSNESKSTSSQQNTRQHGESFPLPPYPDSIENKSAASASSSSSSVPAASQTQSKSSENKEKLETVGGKNSGNGQAHLPVSQGEAPWMVTALAEAEKYGGADESVIEQTENFHSLIHANFPDGNDLEGGLSAWCASFINYCLQVNKFKKWREPQKSQAIAFVQNQDRFVELNEPVFGSMAMLPHHITLVYGLDKNKKGNFIGLGGNQGGEDNTAKGTPGVFGGTIKFSSYPLKRARFFLPKGYDINKNSNLLGKYDTDNLNQHFMIDISKKGNGIR